MNTQNYSNSLQIPVKVGRLCAIFCTDCAPRVVNDQCASNLHDHHDYELRYVAKGTCHQMIAGKKHMAQKGDIIIVHPREYHLQELPCGEAEQYTVRFSVAPATSERADQKAFDIATEFLNSARILHDENCELLPLFQALARELENRSFGFVSNIRSACAMLMTCLLRLSHNDMSKIYPAEELKYHDFERRTIDAFLFESAYRGGGKTSELAKQMCVSERQINNIMHKRFGMSFVAKINEIRLEQAAVLLLHTDRPIEQILGECGFKNYNYFSKCFKNRFGTTPTKYRASHTSVK
ncbi:MAG: AraC family transcriptional regulator [Ruminococcaceae bacterium]|nr:AraC family transcriptional regulator [Oscillospiraceae bacterium]